MHRRIISVFEHECIRSSENDDEKLSKKELEALQRHSGDEGVPYYSLIHNGVKFCEYVGVIQVGNLTIEVLPKIDRGTTEQWRKILVGMLRKVGLFDVMSSSETSLKIKKNSILDLYIEAFLNKMQQIIRQGVIKKYSKKEENITSLKGKLLFQRHILTNIVHKERFYVIYNFYDSNHLLNQILYKTLNLIRIVNPNQMLTRAISNLLLNFPEMPEIKVTEATFDKIVYSRKNEHYRQAITISRLILLNYFPDINSGANHVIALTFDMNLLWERFVYLSLKKNIVDATVEQQANKPYWKLENKRVVKLQPDLVILKNGTKYVLDTKWKLPHGNKPSHSDLQQMYAYTKYFESDHTILCYPGIDEDFTDGHFYNEDHKLSNHYRCSVLRLKFDFEQYSSSQNFIANWQKHIAKSIYSYCNHK